MKKYTGSIVKRGDSFHWRYKTIDGKYTTRTIKHPEGGRVTTMVEAERIVSKFLLLTVFSIKITDIKPVLRQIDFIISDDFDQQTVEMDAVSFMERLLNDLPAQMIKAACIRSVEKFFSDPLIDKGIFQRNAIKPLIRIDFRIKFQNLNSIIYAWVVAYNFAYILLTFRVSKS